MQGETYRSSSSSKSREGLRLKSAEEFGIIEPFWTSLKQPFLGYRHIHYAAVYISDESGYLKLRSLGLIFQGFFT